MTLREFFNNILLVIGATSLTDEEYAPLSGAVGYTQANYDQLSAVLASRESVSSTQDRLTKYFEARGATLTPIKTGSSNIFIGSPL